jgi:cell division protein ZapA (FtsZ GTPase activity inhibitor)
MTLSGSSPKLEVTEVTEVSDEVREQLEAAVAAMRCYNCDTPTDRLIVFRTAIGIVEEYECLDCRQERVRRQVDEGLRPESDLLPENLPEVRNPL